MMTVEATRSGSDGLQLILMERSLAPIGNHVGQTGRHAQLGIRFRSPDFFAEATPVRRMHGPGRRCRQLLQDSRVRWTAKPQPAPRPGDHFRRSVVVNVSVEPDLDLLATRNLR